MYTRDTMETKIIGGGIIGSYLATKLGEKAKIIEKNQDISRKPCGGLISKRGLEELDLPYKEAIVNEVNNAEIHAGNKSFIVEKKNTQAYVLDMVKLKENTREKARDKGAEFRLGETWKPEEEKSKGFLVGADGALSQVAREKSTENQTYNTYQVIANYEGDRDKVDLYFGEYAPEFFAWRIPYTQGKAKIGIGTKRNPEKAFKEFIRKEEIQLNDVERKESSPIPIFNPGKKITGEEWALVGDAAGQVKATTGGGVVMGCRSSEYLSEAIKDEKMKIYRKKYKKNIYPDLLNHLKVRKFLNSTNIEKLINKINKHSLDEVIEEHGDMEHTARLKKEVMKKPRLWPLLLKYWWKIKR